MTSSFAELVLIKAKFAFFALARCHRAFSCTQTSVLMLESFHSDWLIGICSVLFDIDVGQKVLDIYPPGALGEDEASDVAFHAFPVQSFEARFASLSARLQGCTSRLPTCETVELCRQAFVQMRVPRNNLWSASTMPLGVQDSLSAELHSRTSVRDRYGFGHDLDSCVQHLVICRVPGTWLSISQQNPALTCSTFFFRIKRKPTTTQGSQGLRVELSNQQRHYTSHDSDVLYG